MKKLFFLLCILLCLIIPSTCKKLEKTMLVSTGEVTNILTNSADASGQVVDLGGGATQHGHCYAATPNPTLDGSKTQLGVPATGGFTSQLTNLTAGTKYYIKAYLSNATETVYGKEINFSTPAASAPTLTTNAITSITTTTATSGGNITSDGGASVTARGVCWNIATGPSISNSKTTDASGTGSFSSNLSGLTPGTTYYVRAYATNSTGTAYGNELTFTTTAISLPTISTTAISSVTTTTAASGGNITNDGGATITARGVCWSTTTGPTTASNKSSDGTGTGSFVSSLTGLTPGTTYYVRSYATNSAGTAYGNELSFAATAVIPTLTTTAVTSITQTTASSGGNITSDGGATVTFHGVCWSTSSDPTTSSSKTSDGAGTGSFTSSLTGLTANTTYYVRAYATNSAGTAYGNEVNFITSSVTPVVPTLSTTAISSITQTTASSGGNITSNGGALVTVSGICWNTSISPTTANFKTTDGTTTGSFTSSLTGLTANTTYYVRAYATNSAGTAYGNEVNFITSSVTPVVPSLTTTAISSITQTTASSGGNITSNGGALVTVSGICWNTSISPTTANFKTTDGTTTGSFASSLTGLTASTTYYVRAYATNSAGTAYGNELSFTTSATTAVIPTLTTTAITSITQNTASSGGYISSNGGASITACGVCWSTSSNPTISADTSKTVGIGTGPFSSTIKGLTAGTTYHVRAYATNSAGTGYGSDVSFSTTSAVIPTISTSTYSDITATSATCGGTVTADGGASVTARGVCWSTISNPTTSDSKTTDGTGTGYYSSNLTGLAAGTTYHVRAYATNSAGIAYGLDVSFTTLGIPAITTAAITSITQSTATSGGNISSDGGAFVTARGVCWNTATGPTIANSKTSDATGSGSFSSSLTGLTTSTTYYVRAYATNSAGTAYGNEVSFTTLAALPTITTTAISAITSATATSGGNVTSDGGATVTTRGVCWSTITGPTTSDSKTNNGTGTGTFTSLITGLTSNTTYYVRAYATNSAGTAYGNEVSFITYAVTDIDGNNYNAVTIGIQVWMESNLKTTKYNDGTSIPLVTDGTVWMSFSTPGFCYYNNDATTYKDTYGALYNWYTVNTGKLCPSGWHVPTLTDWTTLTTYLGGDAVAGGALKESGTTHWSSPNTGATNSSGFTALPSGYRNSVSDGNFIGIGTDGVWWSSTVYDATYAYFRVMEYNTNAVIYGTGFSNKMNGSSVRCLKN